MNGSKFIQPVVKRIINSSTRDKLLTTAFFQPEGKGYIKNENKGILIPNDTCELVNEIFNLYYTSYCLDKQTIEITT